MNEACSKIITGIKDYFSKNNFSKAVIGLSGGIDSSVTAFLAARALGRENVACILMPEEGLTSDSSVDDAMEVANMLKINHYKIPINNFISNFNSINNNFNIKNNELAIANAKARIRMSILYYFANTHNALVMGTSDKSEIMLGYCTKYGDSASDLMPIGDLWKTELKALGKFLGVPEKILSKKSSPELMEGHLAEKELGADYETLDRIMRLHFEENLSPAQIVLKGFTKELVEGIFERMKVNAHKGRMPNVIKARTP